MRVSAFDGCRGGGEEALPSKEGHFRSNGVLLQLIKSTSSERIGTDERHFQASSHVMICELMRTNREEVSESRVIEETRRTRRRFVALTFVHVVVFPAPCRPTIMMTLVLPF